MNRLVPSLSEVSDNFKGILFDLWGQEKPLHKLFSTDNNYYLYDTGTNRIFCCKKHEFELLKAILYEDISAAIQKFILGRPDTDAHRAILSVRDCMEKFNVLKLAHIDGFGIVDEKDAVLDEIQNRLRILHLEITQSCNLRCGYCIYNNYYKNKRNHSNLHMKHKTAIRAIEYFKKHITNTAEPSIGFYGGEPLLRYRLLKEIVSYAKELIRDKNVGFSITTNGTLINDDVALYLNKERFGVLLSLDGPKEIHDSWRRDMNNGGSFERTLRGLSHLIEAYKGSTHKLGLSIVYAPPYSEEKVERIAEFISSIAWLPEDIRLLITYPQEPDVPKEPGLENKASALDRSLMNWARESYFGAYRKNKKPHPLANALYEKKLAVVMKREINSAPKKRAPLNGCCIPGARKNYITVAGNIEMCERIGLAPSIGNIESGIDFGVIKSRYIDEYAKKSFSKCSTCWLVRMCPICYQQAFYDNEIDISKKDVFCYMNQAEMTEILRDYCSLIEINKRGLDYLSELKIS
jgi:uncharacterized protein